MVFQGLPGNNNFKVFYDGAKNLDIKMFILEEWVLTVCQEMVEMLVCN